MQTYYMVKFGLVLHLMGITLMVGTTIANFAAYQQLWKYLYREKDKATMVINVTKRFPMLQGIGGILIIAGGATMMSAFHGVVIHQFWFQVKLAVLLLIIINPILLMRPAAIKLRHMLSIQQPVAAINPADVDMVRRRLVLFHSLQLTFFLVIFILSAFRFS